MKLAFRLFRLTASFALLSMAPATAQIDAAVPCVEGDTPLLCYGQHANCAINFAGDYDFFRFEGEAGDVVRLSVASTTGCVDPRFEVRDSANQPIFGPEGCFASCSETCISPNEFVLPKSDLFRIIVNESGDTETGNYTIHLEKMLPDYPISSLDYGDAPQLHHIGHRSDYDFVRFEGERGSDISLIVGGANGCIDPHVEVFDPSGALLTEQWCTTSCSSTCNYSVNFTSLPMDGTYTVALSDLGLTETGNVRLSIQCFFSPSGNCPDSPGDGPMGTAYCTSSMNSTGSPATISAYGNTSVTENRIHLTVDDAPAGVPGLLFAGPLSSSGIPLPAPSVGLNCIRQPISRFGVSRVCGTGQAFLRVDLDELPGTMAVSSGSSWNFQYWYRDGSVSNTTDAVELVFTP